MLNQLSSLWVGWRWPSRKGWNILAVWAASICAAAELINFTIFSQMILLFFTARLLLQKFQMGCKRVVYSKDQVRVEVLHLCCFSILFCFMWWFCSIHAQIHCQHMPWLFSDGLDVVGSENHSLREVVHMKVWPL